MILQAPHKDLKTPCKDVPYKTNLEPILKDLLQAVKKDKGIGIAAPQIGVLKRIIWVCTSVYTGFMINPVIVEKSGNLKKSREGCLSLKGHKLVNVQRDRNITIEGFTSDWIKVKIVAKNQSAFVFQHEIDHLNGITLLDHKG